MASPTQTASQVILPAHDLESSSVRPRFDSIDLLRGLVMILMALDHTRGFFSNVTFYPLNLDQTWPLLFLTRWLTHYCAPVFVFLAGTGAFLSTTRGKTKEELAWFLITRGLWLVLLECTVIRWFGWTFNFDLHNIGTGVIWAIGWSMVALPCFLLLPIRYVALIGIALIAGHHLFDPVAPSDCGSLYWFWSILHQGAPINFLPGYTLFTGYPLIPWIGVMAAGYAFGKLVLSESSVRRSWFLGLGCGLIVLFVALRFANVYGDPEPWSPQKNFLFTVFSFINCHKYPPSLLYLAMTLGPALVVLSFLDRGTPRWLKPVLVFGRVPLFYYLLHLPLIHGLALLFSFIRHGRADWLYGSSPAPRPEGYGYDLWVVYAVWIFVILLLYPVCRWFADLKRRRRDAWLSYL